MTSEYRHIPVLLTECIDALELSDHPVFVDATLGFAGHSFEAAKQLGAGGLIIGIDQDEVALTEAAAKLESIPEGARARTRAPARQLRGSRRAARVLCPSRHRRDTFRPGRLVGADRHAITWLLLQGERPT